MPETWVHGNAFIPRLYGPDHLANVGGIAWTDQQGLKEGHAAQFIMRDERSNFFHGIIPVQGRQTLREVRVEFVSSFPAYQEVWVHAGSSLVANSGTSGVSEQLSTSGGVTTLSLSNINQPVTRGLCVSLAFSTVGGGIGQGQISFFAAGAIFA